MAELLETDRFSAINTGRWLVTEKMMHRNYSSAPVNDPASELLYEAGIQSLGFTMDYFPVNCSILSVQDIGEVKETCLASWVSRLGNQMPARAA